MLNSTQAQLFQDELTRIEQEKSSSSEWSQMFLHSRENMFLHDILKGEGFPVFQQKYPELLMEALHRSAETLTLAASEWKAFVEDFFRDKGRAVPDSPLYVEIQEGIGIYGGSSFERFVRRLKGTAQKRGNVFLDKLWRAFRKRCAS